jgi:RNase P subunit RPR2
MKPIGKVVKGRYWVRCRNCDNLWYPDARRWRNNKNLLEDRIIQCPKCHVKNKIPKAVVEYLIKQAEKVTTYGFEPEETP